MSEENKIESGEDIRLSSPFLTKLDNYWYHYKWHTIIGAFLLIVVIVCTAQMCSKKQYDNHVMYVGNSSLSSAQLTGLTESFQMLMEDYNRDGEKNVSIERYFVTFNKETGGLLLGSAITNWDSVCNEILAGEALLCLTSPEVFERLDNVTERGEDGTLYTLLRPLSKLFAEDDPVGDSLYSAYYRYSDGGISDYGVYIHQTPLGSLPGFSSLPKDTVLCLRYPGAMTTWFDFGVSDKVKEQETWHVSLVTAMLKYGWPDENE